MIVTCERCDTRFRLDASRLPARGARVRCSRCKHAFFVRPEGATEAEAVHEVAENAATMLRPATPDPSWDLEEKADPGRTIQAPPRAAPTLAESPGDFDDESDWRFEDEVAQLGDSGASLDLPNGAAPPPDAVDPNESSFAALGDPESWDLSSSASDLPPLVEAPPAPRAPAPVVREPVVVREAPVAIEAPPQTPIAVEPAVEASLAVATEHSLALRLGGGIATALLVAWIVLASVLPSAAPRVADEATASLGPFAVEKLRARLVDNTFAGPLWVVQGELVNASQEPRALEGRVAVRLLDADGDAIEGAVATAQPVGTEQRLREEEPERIGESVAFAAADLARRALAPGERVAIEAVFATASGNAVRFAVEQGALEPLPSMPAPSPARVEPAPPPSLEPASEPAPGTAPPPPEG